MHIKATSYELRAASCETLHLGDPLSALSRQLSGFRTACKLSSHQAVRICVMCLATTVPAAKLRAKRIINGYAQHPRTSVYRPVSSVSTARMGQGLRRSLPLQYKQILIRFYDFLCRIFLRARFCQFAVPEDFERARIGFELCFFQPFQQFVDFLGHQVFMESQ